MNIDPTKWQLTTTHVRAGSEITSPKGEGWRLVATHAVPVQWTECDIRTIHGAHVVCIWVRPRDPVC